MENRAADFIKKVRIVVVGTLTSFGKNNDLSAASSLAFSATLALIPSLFLLTFILGAVIGSSGRAFARTQAMLTQLIPAYSQDILREVRFISAHLGTIGVLNALILLWSATPLVADMRIALGTIFRKKPSRPFLLEKLIDLAISIVFLIGLAAIVIAGVFFSLAEHTSAVQLTFGPLERAAPFAFVTAVGFILYFLFSGKARLRHLLVGAVAAAALWFAIRPAFHLFLMYNPGYGFAFGSFKSLFVVIIWIYFSLVVFLLGAELAASLGRGETAYIKHLMEGGRNVPDKVVGKYVTAYEQGGVVFREGDPGDRMFCVLSGKVSIVKDGREIAVIPSGKCFGGMSFLLATPRVASATALEDTKLVALSNDNINDLMNEYPEFVVEMLREMAGRLREANKGFD
ncbi:MAG TPA: YhjD/YihY/BrkB family envelope integrity protein [Nitrospirota bacterium]|nr:YhjD/YihY/BrkB family envelope integrity protein [Nitrospirota bacterium]